MKRSLSMFSRHLVLIVGSVLLLSVGCAHSVVVAPKAPERTMAEKLPLDVGLHLTREFRSYRLSEFRKGDKWNYDNLGVASAAQFQLGLDQIFRTVEVVEDRPPFREPRSRVLHAVIEPAIDKFDFDIPVTKFQVYPARIHYKVTVYDPNGTVLFSRQVEGVGDLKGSPGFDFAENPSKAASKAVADGAARALELLMSADEIKALLKQ